MRGIRNLNRKSRAESETNGRQRERGVGGGEGKKGERETERRDDSKMQHWREKDKRGTKGRRKHGRSFTSTAVRESDSE